MKNATKGSLICKSALLLDIGAPLAATLSQFPVWVARSSDATVSGIFLVFALLSAIPLMRAIKSAIHSPSAPMVWTGIFLVFFALNSIMSEALIICGVGAVSNWVGAAIHKLGTKVAEKPN